MKPSAEPAITIEERILLHLSRYAADPDGYEAPDWLTQEGIARAISTRRSIVIASLRRLIKAGLVELRMHHVNNSRRRKYTFFLSDKGVLASNEAQYRISSIPVRIKKKTGGHAEVPISDLGVYLGYKPSVVDIVNSIRPDLTLKMKSLESKYAAAGRKQVAAFSESPARAQAFVGRKKEMQALCGIFRSKGAAVACIEGAPGIGKTSLAAQAVDECAADRKGDLFWYRIRRWEGLGKLLWFLGDFMSQLEMPRLAAMVQENPSPSIAEVEVILREDLIGFEGLFVIDDLHEADNQTLEFLAILSREIASSGKSKIAFISRPSKPSSQLCAAAAGAKGVQFSRITLDGLDWESSRQMLEMAGTSHEDALKAFRITRGHPLFLSLIAKKDLSGKRQIINYLQRECINNLPQAQKRFLWLISVFRYPVETSFICGVFGTTAEHLRGLQSSGLVSASGEGQMKVHDLVRDALMQRMEKGELLKNHEIAQRYYRSAIDKLGWRGVLELAYHMQGAGDWHGAARTLVRGHGQLLLESSLSEYLHILDAFPFDQCTVADYDAVANCKGDVLEVQSRFDEALSHYGSVAAIMHTQGEKELALASELKAAYLLARLKRPDGVQASLSYVNARSRRLRPQDKALFLLIKAMIDMDRKGAQKTLPEVAAAVKALDSSGAEARHAAQGHMLLGECLRRVRKVEEALAELQMSAAIYMKAGMRLQARGLTTEIASCLQFLGKPDEARKILLEHLELCQRVGNFYDLGRVLHNLSSLFLAMGEYETAQDYATRSIEAKKKTGNLSGQALSMGHLAIIHINRGENAAAMDLLERQIDIYRKLDNNHALFVPYINLAHIYGVLGLFPQALEIYGKALRIQLEDGGERTTSMIRLLIAGVHLQQGRLPQALKEAQRGLRLARETKDMPTEAVALNYLGWHDFKAGNGKGALRYYASAAQLFGRMKFSSMNLLNMRRIAKAHLLLGHVGRAVEIAREAMETASRMSLPGDMNQARLIFGIGQERLGNYPEADKAYDSACRFFRATGHTYFSARVDVFRASLLVRMKREEEGSAMLEKAMKFLRNRGITFDDIDYRRLLGPDAVLPVTPHDTGPAKKGRAAGRVPRSAPRKQTYK